MGLRAYIMKRIVYTFILILFVITLNFIIFLMMPGDPTQLFINPTGKLSPDEIRRQMKALQEMYGLGDPPHIRYIKAARSLLTWNFGDSIVSGQSVAGEMLRRLPYSVFLLGTSVAVSIAIGIVLGALAAYKRGSTYDTVTLGASLFLYSVPIFWLGMIFIYIFSTVLGWLPSSHARPEWAQGVPIPFTTGSSVTATSLNAEFVIAPGFTEFVHGYLLHATLPLITLVVFQYGGYMLLTRAVMLEALTEDYVITARAKGVPERTVLFRHALKNASLPLITNIALGFAGIFSGAVITETIFTYPGVGRWIYEAAVTRDYNVLMPVFYVIALAVIIANFIADLVYGIIDPRIKYE